MGADVLDLDFTDEQEMLREMVRGVLAQSCPLDVVRAMEDDPTGYPKDLWAQLAELDLLGLLVPPEHGGSGMTMLEGVILYEELGRALAPTPHLVSCVLSAGALGRAGSDAQRSEWLPRVVSGGAIITPAWLEPENGYSPRGVQTRAVADREGWTITGTKQHVHFASSVDRLLVLARTGDEPDAVDLFLVDPRAAGLSLTQKLTIGSDTQYRVDLDGVRVDRETRVGGEGTGWRTWSDVMADGMILAAAQANGGARYALEITVQYAKDRVQFDKPLGAFQALAHDMADAGTAVDGSTMLAYEAAWARSTDRSVERLAPMAKLFACNTFRDTTAMAQQIFGGVGFTLEYDIQLYFRRAKALQLSWNDTRRCEELIAAAVLDG